ncbi:hypothetical protein HK104_002090 [Borealophlyctis nickersoniae]|nr:hypothetical protein HK104_002090 [Borealophlyctis nickersoniae]
MIWALGTLQRAIPALLLMGVILSLQAFALPHEHPVSSTTDTFHIPSPRCAHDLSLDPTRFTHPATSFARSIVMYDEEPPMSRLERRQDPPSNVPVTDTWDGIRIFFDNRYLEEDVNAPGAKDGINATEVKGVIQQLLPVGQEWFRNVVNVKQVQGNLTIARSWCQAYDSNGVCTSADTKTVESCGDVVIPSDHLANFTVCNDAQCTIYRAGPGVSADLIMYTSYKNTSLCSPNNTGLPSQESVFAHASFCRLDQNDRPIAGSINFCPGQIANTTVEWDVNNQISSLLHELSHVMAFSRSLFPFFRYPDGSPRTPRDDANLPPLDNNNEFVASNISTLRYFEERGTRVAKLVLNETLTKAREHFGCADLNGVELESQGGPTIAGSHLEKRVFGYDYMTGQGIPGIEPDFTPVSLSVFEASGWYTVNYDYTTESAWGNGKGCSFAVDKCLTTSKGSKAVTTSDDSSFCNGTVARRCTVGRLAKGSCVLTGPRDNVTVPPEYRWFNASLPVTSKWTGGSVPLMDFCPIYTPTGVFHKPPSPNADCRFPMNSLFAAWDPIETWGEIYSPSSRCVDSTALKNGYVPLKTTYPACYPVRCRPGTANVSVEYDLLVGVQWVDCGEGGEVADAPGGYSGTLEVAVENPVPADVADGAGVFQMDNVLASRDGVERTVHP